MKQSWRKASQIYLKVSYLIKVVEVWFINKMPVTSLEALLTEFVVGNTRSVFLDTTANLA